MKQAIVDDKRRVALPRVVPGAHVTIEQLDGDTWVVRRRGTPTKLRPVLIPVIDNLPDDPEWDKVENAFGRAAFAKLRQSRPD
jgi:hypothetical protein